MRPEDKEWLRAVEVDEKSKFKLEVLNGGKTKAAPRGK